MVEVVFPVGMITPYAGGSAPGGWLLCNGAAVSRATYAALFAVLGTLYGAGNGSTTFNLPDLQGKVPVGLNAADTDFDVLGEAGGAKTSAHTHTGPSHTHTGPSHTHSINAHHHETSTGSIYGGGNSAIGSTTPGHNDTSETALTTNADGTGNTGAGGTGNTGSTAPSTVQPYQTVNYIIKY